MIVLVTGANGFLGRHLAKRFAADGHTVIGLGRGNWPEAEYRAWGLAEWYQGGVCLALLGRIDVTPDLIVHCAGGGSVIRSVREPHADFTDTVQGTADVLEYARLHAPQARIIYPSSPAVQGVHDESPIRTTDPHRPVSPYGFHKMMAESLCDSYRMTYGLDISIIRFFSIYGAGLCKQLLWDACHKLSKGGQAEFWGDGGETRDWVHVEDAVALVVCAAAAAREELPVLMNCGNGISHTTREVLCNLRDCLGVGTEVCFNGITREGDPRYYLADISEAERLGWRPEMPMEAGMRSYVEWFKGLS